MGKRPPNTHTQVNKISLVFYFFFRLTDSPLLFLLLVWKSPQGKRSLRREKGRKGRGRDAHLDQLQLQLAAAQVSAATNVSRPSRFAADSRAVVSVCLCALCVFGFFLFETNIFIISTIVTAGRDCVCVSIIFLILWREENFETWASTSTANTVCCMCVSGWVERNN